MLDTLKYKDSFSTKDTARGPEKVLPPIALINTLSTCQRGQPPKEDNLLTKDTKGSLGVSFIQRFRCRWPRGICKSYSCIHGYGYSDHKMVDLDNNMADCMVADLNIYIWCEVNIFFLLCLHYYRVLLF